MQTIPTINATWYLTAQKAQPGVPPRIVITPPFRIGRREGFDLCLSCRNVSGLHAEFLQENGRLWIEDLNSTNGTFVNGERIRKRTRMNDGDTVQFGTTIFAVTHVGDNSAISSENVEPLMSDTLVPESTELRFERLLKDGVVPYFQPIYKVSSDSKKQRVGYEVLGRSRLFGLKTPDQMFAVATDLEKESELSRTLRLRGIEAAESSVPNDMSLFVNTHPAEMDCGMIQSSLSDIRSKYPTRPIVLELAERVLYAPESYSQLVDSVKDLNVQLALHDFGAGQIRLAELSEMSPDIVKFDGALTQGIDNATKKRQQLVAAMVKIAVELGITPMAEFVETETEHETLKQLGFKLVQGFYYGHPDSIENMTAAIDSSKTMARINNRSEQRPVETICETYEPVTTIVVPGERSVLNVNFLAEEESHSTSDIKDAQWLLNHEDDCFTIQLMFAATNEAAESFVAEQNQPGNYAIYRKWSSGREWHVVVFGIFAQRDEAKSTMDHFKDTGHSSWVRKLTKVKEEILSIENAE